MSLPFQMSNRLPPLGGFCLSLLLATVAAWANPYFANGAAGADVADGLLLGMLLTAAPQHRGAYVVARVLAGALGLGLNGIDPGIALYFGLCHGALLFVAGAGLHDTADTLRAFARPGGLRRFVTRGLILPPVMLTLLVGPIELALWHAAPMAALGDAGIASAIGIAVVTPLILAIDQGGWYEPLVGEHRRDNLLMFGGFLATLAASFVQSAYAVACLPLPLMLLVAWRMGLTGAALAMAGGGAIVVGCSVAGMGPLGGGQVLVVQVYLLAMWLLGFPVGQYVVRRRRADAEAMQKLARLARSEWLFRRLAENSGDIITRAGLDGRRRYVSPSVEAVLGYTVAQALKAGWDSAVHPDDCDALAAAQAAMRAGQDRALVLARFRRVDGVYVWLEINQTLVRNAQGSPSECISNVRDVTKQKQIEEALEAANARLSEQVGTDGLTEIANRRHFDDALQKEWQRAMRSAVPVGLLMVDVDHFKSFNDTAGHQAGDDCLRMIAKTIAGSIRRPSDLAARYGGEEFAVILPETDLAGGREIARRVREAIAAAGWEHPATGKPLTVSMGCAALVPMRYSTPQGLIALADGALYAAKHNGRDRVECADPNDPASKVVPFWPGRVAGG